MDESLFRQKRSFSLGELRVYRALRDAKLSHLTPAEVASYARVARRSTSTILARFAAQGLVQHVDLSPQAFYTLVKDDSTLAMRNLFDLLLGIIEQREALEQ